HYGDRTPSLVLLAPVKGGINPFTRILAEHNGKVVFDTDVLREEITAWRDELDGTVYLGWAPGFLGDQREKVRAELAEEIDADAPVIDHPRVVFGGLADEIEAGLRDTWFDDPTP